MTTEEIVEFLRQKVDKGVVTVHFTDGEVVEAIIHHVSDGEEDVIFKIISTNRPEKHGDLNAALFVSPFSEFVSIS